MKKPWLLLPPQLAHDLAPAALALGAYFQPKKIPQWNELKWKGLTFPNRLGTAGGVDKNGDLIEEYWAYGAGFVEIGTVTPKPQDANPGKIMDRDFATKALWNKMGFPGEGAASAKENLRDLPDKRRTPIFVNIGKNRTTENDRAAKDYAACVKTLTGLADVFVINISSPNTTGLRELLQPKNFQRFLGSVLAEKNKAELQTNKSTPVLIKISPDAADQDLKAVVEISCELGIDGFVATNTTLFREHGSPFPPEGGVSGQPLAARSKDVLSLIRETLGAGKGERLLVSAGGVMSTSDVKERLVLGADLVQVYSALIYEGPGFFRQVARSLQAKQD